MYFAKIMESLDCPWHDIFTEETIPPPPRRALMKAGMTARYVPHSESREIRCDGANGTVLLTDGDTTWVELCEGCANCCPEPVA